MSIEGVKRDGHCVHLFDEDGDSIAAWPIAGRECWLESDGELVCDGRSVADFARALLAVWGTEEERKRYGGES